jgi:hypothetical protein
VAEIQKRCRPEAKVHALHERVDRGYLDAVATHHRRVVARAAQHAIATAPEAFPDLVDEFEFAYSGTAITSM